MFKIRSNYENGLNYYLRYLSLRVICIFLLTAPTSLVAQNTRSIPPERIPIYKDKIKKIYYQLEGIIINLCAATTSAEDIQLSVDVAKRFFKSDAQIKDFIGGKIQLVDQFKYFELLRNEFKLYYDIEKTWELTSISDFEEKVVASVPDSVNPNNRQLFKIYSCQLIFIEALILTHPIGKDDPKTPQNEQSGHINEEKKFTKVINFELRPNPQNIYTIFIVGIDILEEKVDKKTEEQSEASELNPYYVEYLAKTELEKLPKIITLVEVPSNRSLSPIVNPAHTIERPYQELDTLRFIQYVIPGIGHLEYNRPVDRFWATLYGTSATLAIANGIKSNIQKNPYYSRHLDATKYSQLNSNYTKANQFWQESLKSFGVAAGIILINVVHLKLKQNAQRKKEKERLRFSQATQN